MHSWVNFSFPESQILLFLGFLFVLMEDGLHLQMVFLIVRKVYGRWTFWFFPTWHWLYFISYLIDSLADYRVQVWNISHPDLQMNFFPVFQHLVLSIINLISVLMTALGRRLPTIQSFLPFYQTLILIKHQDGCLEGPLSLP